jgi:GT2 family glycosyltransferase
MAATETITQRPIVSVIVPARNEEVSLGDCLQSLVGQTGIAFEIIVVDDDSTDRTREIAASFPKVRVIGADPLLPGWTGKNNAVTSGARHALGEWLLFTDADTVHLPGSLAASVKEAQECKADLLSYSPEQIVRTFSEKAVMPVIFAELATQFRPKDVSDPASTAAAANGQYILITREAYDAVGGHAALAGELLEDVALARAIKQSGHRIFFRYGADRVRTRMYRSFVQLREGWTRNLALLFARPHWLAVRVLVMWMVAWSGPFLVVLIYRAGSTPAVALACLAVLVALASSRFAGYVIRSNFAGDAEILAAIFGPPIFAYLLVRSCSSHKIGNVSWKNRTYGHRSEEKNRSRSANSKLLATTENRELKTGN